VPGTLRVISVGLDYGRRDDAEAWATLADGERAYVAATRSAATTTS
jgi:epoxyqueuosine reductase